MQARDVSAPDARSAWRPDCSCAAGAAAALRELGLLLPELEPYQDEPPQMASGAVGKMGYLRLQFDRDPATFPCWPKRRCTGTNRSRTWPA